MSQPKSKNFMLAVATVMLGPREDLMTLNPEEHSIGLVKNYTVSVDRSSTDLTAGVQNDLVFSLVTQSDTRSTMEVYEYTAKNMSYALGLFGYQISEEVTGAPYIMSAIGVNNADKTHELTVTVNNDGQTITDGMDVSIRYPNNDNIIIAKVIDASGLATGTLVVNCDIGTTIIPSGAIIQAVSILELGSSEEQAELAAKVTGQLADGTWVTILNPRVRITSSFSAAFSSENYGNMPFEWRNLKVLPGEGFYADFKGMSGKLAKDAQASMRT